MKRILKHKRVLIEAIIYQVFSFAITLLVLSVAFNQEPYLKNVGIALFIAALKTGLYILIRAVANRMR